MSETPKRVYTITEACNYTGRTRSGLYEAVERGEVRSFKVGRRRLFLRDDLDAYIDWMISTARAAGRVS